MLGIWLLVTLGVDSLSFAWQEARTVVERDTELQRALSAQRGFSDVYRANTGAKRSVNDRIESVSGHFPTLMMHRIELSSSFLPFRLLRRPWTTSFKISQGSQRRYAEWLLWWLKQREPDYGQTQMTFPPLLRLWEIILRWVL